jgi:hypothetical protein
MFRKVLIGLIALLFYSNCQAQDTKWHIKWEKDLDHKYFVLTSVYLYKDGNVYYKDSRAIHVNDYDVDTENQLVIDMINKFKEALNQLNLDTKQRKQLINQATNTVDNLYFK